MNTADSTINFADPVFLGINAVFGITILPAFGRWLWLLVAAIIGRWQSRKHIVEFVALSIALTALALTIVYAIFVFSEAASWRR